MQLGSRGVMLQGSRREKLHCSATVWPGMQRSCRTLDLRRGPESLIATAWLSACDWWQHGTDTRRAAQSASQSQAAGEEQALDEEIAQVCEC